MHPSPSTLIPCGVPDDADLEVCFAGLGSSAGWARQFRGDKMVLTFFAPMSAEVNKVPFYGASFAHALDVRHAPALRCSSTGLADLWATDLRAVQRAAVGVAALTGREAACSLLEDDVVQADADLVLTGLMPHEWEGTARS